MLWFTEGDRITVLKIISRHAVMLTDVKGEKPFAHFGLCVRVCVCVSVYFRGLFSYCSWRLFLGVELWDRIYFVFEKISVQKLTHFALEMGKTPENFYFFSLLGSWSEISETFGFIALLGHIVILGLFVCLALKKLLNFRII